MNLETFLMLLMIVSVIVPVFMQGVKAFLDGCNIRYASNLVVSIVAVVVSSALYGGFICLKGISMGADDFVYLVALCALGWLGSMVGYDKVKQMLLQIFNK